MKDLVVLPVRTARQNHDFFRLRRTLYRNDPAVVFPLDKLARLQLDTARHPFYEHATREMFVAYQGDVPVGRIAAICDRMHQEYHGDKTGFFGFMEAIDDQQVVDALISAATTWLQTNGCQTMRGPVDPSMKGEFGVLVEGNSTSPSIMMAHNFRRYRDQLLSAGFQPIREFCSYHYFTHQHTDVKPQWEALFKACRRIQKRFPQLSFRPVQKETFIESMRQINELGNRVRAEGWGFVPLTENELTFMINNLRRVIRYDMIHMAYWNDQLVGYIVNIPDVNWALRRARGPYDWIRMLQLPRLIAKAPRTRVIALGVDPDYRSKGIAMLLIAQLVERSEAFDEWEFSWVDSENVRSIRAIQRTLPLIKKRVYLLFEKSIQIDQEKPVIGNSDQPHP